MKLYTRTGDAGETSLADGTRVGKDDARPEACGTLDELSAHLGLAHSGCRNDDLAGRLVQIQRELLVLGSELALAADAAPARAEPRTTDEMVACLERWIDEASEAVPPLTQFIVPGGEALACRLHVARTVCRRAERRIVTVSRTAPVSPQALRYVNRLSDLLYAWARQVNHASGAGDVKVDVGRSG